MIYYCQSKQPWVIKHGFNNNNNSNNNNNNNNNQYS